jgi:hypothetical protein
MRLSIFTRLTLKLEEPYNLTFLFNKPTALELLTINNQTSQLYTAFQASEEKVEALRAMVDYQVQVAKQYCSEVHGLEDDTGKPIVLSNNEEVIKFLDYLTLEMVQKLYGQFLEKLNVTEEEKKS